MDIAIYYSLYAVALLLTVGNTCVFVYMMYEYIWADVHPHKNPLRKVKKLIFKVQVMLTFSEYFNWIGFHPCMLVFLEELYCSDDFVNALSIECGSVNVGMSFASFIG